MGIYAIVKIHGAKLIGTDKTCQSKFPCSEQEKKDVSIDNIYHSEPYTRHQTSDPDRTSTVRGWLVARSLRRKGPLVWWGWGERAVPLRVTGCPKSGLL